MPANLENSAVATAGSAQHNRVRDGWCRTYEKQRQNSKEDGTGGLKTLRVKSPTDWFHTAFVELLLCRKYLRFFENISFPCSQSYPQLMFFFWIAMFFSVQRAPDGWEQRSLQEHQRNNQCMHKQHSSLHWPSVPKSALLLSICSSRSLWPQPISPCTLVNFCFCFLLFFLMVLQRHLANIFPQATRLENVCFHSNPKEEQYWRMFKLLYNFAHFICKQGHGQNPSS